MRPWMVPLSDLRAPFIHYLPVSVLVSRCHVQYYHVSVIISTHNSLGLGGLYV